MGLKSHPLKFLKPPRKFSMRPSVSRNTRCEQCRVYRMGRSRAAPTDTTQKASLGGVVAVNIPLFVTWEQLEIKPDKVILGT